MLTSTKKTMIFFAKAPKIITFQNGSIKSNPNLGRAVFFKGEYHLAFKPTLWSPEKRVKKLLCLTF